MNKKPKNDGVWRPLNARQREALSRSEFEILTGGERGGGKSEIGRAWLLEPEYVNHPRYRALILRRNVKDLEDWIFRMREFAGDLVKITGNPPRIDFPGGGMGTLGHLSTKDSYSHYVGQEYQKILIEELNLIPEEKLYLQVMASCRSSIPELPCQIMSSANPGGPGHSFVKKRFVDCCDGKPIMVDGQSRIFIRLKLTENHKLPESYINTLKQLPKALQLAWLEGDWNALAGQMFPVLPPQIDPHKIDTGRFLGSFDFGSSETGHSSYGHWWVRPDGVLERVFTWYHRLGHTAGDQALELVEYIKSFPFTQGKMPEKVFADPSIFAKRKEIGIDQTPRSVADYFADQGLTMVPGINNRVNGWRICNDYFVPNMITQEPKMVCWSGYNETFYEHFSLQIRAENNRDDTEANNLDHVCDEARYLLSSIFSEKSNEHKPVYTINTVLPQPRRIFAGWGSNSNAGWMR